MGAACRGVLLADERRPGRSHAEQVSADALERRFPAPPKLVHQFVDLAGGLGPLAVLAGIYLLAALITQPMSNAAAVVLMVPIAIDAAQGLGASVQPFVLATVIGASTSFLTPVGHKANVLVFGPGGYKFFDYTRVGAPLNVLLFVVILVTLPLVWPLFP